jgi:hypothetical protein
VPIDGTVGKDGIDGRNIRGLALLYKFKIIRKSPKTGDPNLDHG